MKFYFVEKKDYHFFSNRIVICISNGNFYGKNNTLTVGFSSQEVICGDYREINDKNARKLAFLLGEDLSELVKEYEAWKQKKK